MLFFFFLIFKDLFKIYTCIYKMKKKICARPYVAPKVLKHFLSGHLPKVFGDSCSVIKAQLPSNLPIYAHWNLASL